jgi:hypothetical protein
MEELGTEIAELQTQAANHAKELETIEARRLTCPAAEIDKLMNRKDVVRTLLDRTNVTLAERDADYGAIAQQIRADEKAWRDGEPLRKIGMLMQEIETDLAPLRVALDPQKWQRIQKNLFELRMMNVMNIQTTPRVVTMDGPGGETFMQPAHGPLAREGVSRIAGELAPLFNVLAQMLGR